MILFALMSDLTILTTGPHLDMPRFDADRFGQVVLPMPDNFAPPPIVQPFEVFHAEPIGAFPEDSDMVRLGRPVGRLDVLTRHDMHSCTAFLVAANRVLTNAHCIPDEAVSARLTLGYRLDGVAEGTMTFEVSTPPLERRPALDVAVVQVSGEANARFGALSLSDRTPEKGDRLWVIGHPLGGAQRIVREQCRALGTPAPPGWMHHSCDILSGNDGSPMFDPVTGHVVAMQRSADEASGVSYAVPMADILAASDILSAAR